MEFMKVQKEPEPTHDVLQLKTLFEDPFSERVKICCARPMAENMWHQLLSVETDYVGFSKLRVLDCGLLQVASLQHPHCEVWRPSDFPPEPPAAADISIADYQIFKRDHIGTAIPRAWLTPHQLKQAGCRSWKQYWLIQLLINWG